NGQTIGNAANFTGTLNTGGALTVASGGATISAGGLTITSGDINASASNSNLNLGTGTVTSGLVNGQTIGNAANFTGTLNTGGALTVASGGATISAGGLTITSGDINASASNSNLNLGTATATSCRSNGQTIGNAANFTGTLNTGG